MAIVLPAFTYSHWHFLGLSYRIVILKCSTRFYFIKLPYEGALVLFIMK